MNKFNREAFADVTLPQRARVRIHRALDAQAGQYTAPKRRISPQTLLTAAATVLALVMGVGFGVAVKNHRIDPLRPTLTVQAFVAQLDPDQDIYQALLESDILSREQRQELENSMAQGQLPDSRNRLEALQSLGLYGENRLPSRAEVGIIIAASSDYTAARAALIEAVGPPLWDQNPSAGADFWWSSAEHLSPKVCYYLDDGSALMVIEGSYFVWGDWQSQQDGTDIVVLGYRDQEGWHKRVILSRIIQGLGLTQTEAILSFEPDPDHVQESEQLRALIDGVYAVQYTGDASAFPRENTPWSIWALARHFKMLHSNFRQWQGETWPGEQGGIRCTSVTFVETPSNYNLPQDTVLVYAVLHYQYWDSRTEKYNAEYMGSEFYVGFQDGEITYLQTNSDTCRDIFALVETQQNRLQGMGHPVMDDEGVKDFLEGPQGRGVLG